MHTHTHTNTRTHMTRSYISTANLLGPWIGHLPSLGSFSYLRQRIEMLSHTDIWRSTSSPFTTRGGCWQGRAHQALPARVQPGWDLEGEEEAAGPDCWERGKASVAAARWAGWEVVLQHFMGTEGKNLQAFVVLLLLFSCSVMCDSLWPRELRHTRFSCPSLPPRVCSNSCPLSRWCHPTISSSVTLFSSCPQCFPASESFPVSWLFASGGQSIWSFSISPSLNIQDWFPLELTGLISLADALLIAVGNPWGTSEHSLHDKLCSSHTGWPPCWFCNLACSPSFFPLSHLLSFFPPSLPPSVPSSFPFPFFLSPSLSSFFLFPCSISASSSALVTSFWPSSSACSQWCSATMHGVTALINRRRQLTQDKFGPLTDQHTPGLVQSQAPASTLFCLPEAGVGLGIGLCSVPYFQCISGIFVHTLSPGSVAHLDGRLR